MSVPDTNYDSEDILTVVFCVPNTPDWRQAVTALLSNLTYGRAYDDRTTNIIEALAVGRKIFNSMQLCNLEVHLEAIATYAERIASALDGGQQRYSIADIIQSLNDIDTGLDVLDYLDVLNFFAVLIEKLPGINLKLTPLEWVKFAGQWRITQSQLNYAEDIALSLRGINIGTGGVPMQAVYENLGDGFNTIAAGFTGGQSAAIQFLMQVIRGKDLGIGQDIIEVLEAIGLGSMRGAQYNIASTLEDLQAAMSNCGCGQNPCICEPEINGPASDQTETGYDPCCPPEGFNEFLDYELYLCKAANHLTSAYGNFFSTLNSVPEQFLDNLQALDDRREPIFETEVYRRLGLYIATSVDTQVLAQITNAQRNDLLTTLTAHYMAYQVEILNNPDDGPFYLTQRQDFWYDAFGPVGTYYRDNYDTVTQAFFDAAIATGLASELVTRASAAAGEATGPYDTLADSLKTLIISNGVANLAYTKNATIENVLPKYACTGTLCDCTKVTVVYGTPQGNDIYGSTYAGGPDAVQLWAYVDTSPPSLPDDICGPKCKCIISGLTDWQPFVPPDYFVYDDDGSVIYSGNEPWPQDTVGRGFYIRSGDAFSVRLQLVEVC